MIAFRVFSPLPNRPQRPSTKGKPDGRKSQAPKSTSAANKNAKKSASTTSVNKKKPGTAGHADGSNKEEETKEEEPPEEEKRFEAANHMEGDLVDILGKKQSPLILP